MTMDREQREILIARRVAREFKADGRMLFVNLGIGIPTRVAEYVDANVIIQSENGMLGVGPIAIGDQVDDQLIDASRRHVVETPGCVFIDSAAAFGLIRGGHLDATVLGAFEVDQAGNLANWIVPGGRQIGVGGAMDLVAGAKRVIVAMQYLNKDGGGKVRKACSLPLTGAGVVDMIVTDLAVFKFIDGQLVLTELAPGVTVAAIRATTDAEFSVSEDLGILRAE